MPPQDIWDPAPPPMHVYSCLLFLCLHCPTSVGVSKCFRTEIQRLVPDGTGSFFLLRLPGVSMHLLAKNLWEAEWQRLNEGFWQQPE